MKQSIPAPIVAVVVVLLLAVVGFFLYKGATGGVQGDGKVGNVEASPPIPKHAQEQMMQGAGKR